ncbi:hypothetical protein [Streptomyces sp. NPDC059957]|uniref:hypothetical protein n=1 Tax=unclassified Streptomyces TaxID=2593676 RepID=UPI00365EDAF7
MRIGQNIVGAVFRPGAVTGERVVWLLDIGSNPLHEVPESDARALLFELAELFDLVACDPKVLSGVAE